MGISPGLVQFGEYAPDLTPIGTGMSQVIRNVVPQADGYGPFKSFVAFTSALGAQCRGYFQARNADGSITIFGATSTKIYKLDNTTFTWGDVSKGGASYSAVPTGFHWRFVQFNTLVIAVQANTAPQVFTLGSSSAFGDLGGSPPNAAFVAIINRFVVLVGIVGFASRIQWSGLNAPTTWDNVTAQSNYQDLADGGATIGVAGNDQFGVVFQQAAIRNMIFAPGSATVFDIIKISDGDGALNAGSICTAGDQVFFYSPQGFKVILPGGYPTPIGREKVDRTFFAELDTANLQYFMASADPTQTRVYWAYKSTSGAAGAFDKILCYDRVLKKFTPIIASGEFMTALARPGLTLEALDPIAPGALTITGAANNGSGLIRITVASTATLTTGDIKAISGVVGTTEANNNWTITVIDATHFDLQGSAFVNAYVSGGVVGGSLDALPFSLDDVSLASLVQLSIVSTSHVVGFFSGSNMEAILDTPEQDGLGRRFHVSGLRPLTDSADAVCSTGYRNSPSAAPSYTTETSLNTIGVCPQRIDTRYGRGRLRIPAASTWSFARGIEPEFRMTGTR